jgi:ABC-type lipoprotein export system ATPase subunit
VFEVFEHLVSDQGKTIVMVTHDQSLGSRFTRTLRIADGEMESTEPSSDGFLEEEKNVRVQL